MLFSFYSCVFMWCCLGDWKCSRDTYWVYLSFFLQNYIYTISCNWQGLCSWLNALSAKWVKSWWGEQWYSLITLLLLWLFLKYIVLGSQCIFFIDYPAFYKLMMRKLQLIFISTFLFPFAHIIGITSDATYYSHLLSKCNIASFSVV